jgi:hypothetical protein
MHDTPVQENNNFILGEPQLLAVLPRPRTIFAQVQGKFLDSLEENERDTDMRCRHGCTRCASRRMQ